MVAAEDDGAQGEVNFMDKADFEKRGIDFATAFAEETLDFPFAAQPAERGGEINLSFAADFYFVGKRTQLAQLGAGYARGGEDDDGGEAVLGRFRRWDQESRSR